MRHVILLCTWLVPTGLSWAQGLDSAAIVRTYRPVAERIIREATRDSFAYARLAELCDRFGPRFSGTPNLERAIDWILEQMRADGLENVRGEPVPVPRWVRGEESAELLAPVRRRLPMLGLGGSIGTPPEGITAEVLVVRDFEELRRRAHEARGRIVLFNAPFTNYGETVRYRTQGAIEAARAGAVASLIRSVTPFSLQTPHTGSMSYDPQVPRIPHAAITVEDAELIARFAARGERPVVRLQMGARQLPDTLSRNVIAELIGRERPEEVVVIGGHIDSWDVGQGAMDDAGGCVATWEAVRLLKRLGLRPRRTIRVVLWTNEENGLRGALAYAERYRQTRHVLAIESDAGVFRPLGFGFTGSEAAYRIVRAIGSLLMPIGAHQISRGGGGADIGPLMRQGVPGMGLVVDGTRYFWYHHTEADTVDKLDPGELNLCIAALAIMAYVVADLPEGLPRD
ncbi:MAG: M28 family metallopeptidase [Bacteroidetes bacterium]|nr:M28 family metallopeptidase [Bacteroidota bacterium]MDW8137429.1 M28 family metallopeptidase [Bacteroidota bacterium]